MSAAAVRALLTTGARALADGAPVHIFLGNEAADADSCVGALAAALAAAGAPRAAGAPAIVPVLSCARGDWPLRREAVVIAERWLGAGAPLIFLDDAERALPRDAAAAPMSTAITLFDHNALTGALAARGFGALVVSIIDHHADAGAHATVRGAARRVDYDAAAQRGCGSACSLLLAGPAPAPLTDAALDAPLARALLSVIALDCVGFARGAGKATAVDAAAVARAAAAAPGADVPALYAELSALRADAAWWLGLPPAAALGLDYKGFAAASGLRLGTSALMLPARDFFAGAGPEDARARAAAAAAFAAARDVDLLAVCSLAPAPLARALILLPATPRGAAAVAAAVAALASDAAGFALAEEPAGALAPLGARAFAQGNVVASRKQAVPLLLAALAEF